MSISARASVSPKAAIGRGVSIGDFTIVHENVVLEDGVSVDSHCILGYPTPLAQGQPLVIGQGSLIRSHSIFYEGSTFGPGLRTGHKVTLREKLVAGKDLLIGTLCDFQGHATIGEHVRVYDNSHVCQLATIGNCVWIFPYTVLTNDPHPPSEGSLQGPIIEDYAVIATMCCILPGVRIGARSLVGAHSLVTKDVEPDSLVGGVPAKSLGKASKILLRDGTGRPAYPWMRHFHRGYPPEVLEDWKREFGSWEP